MKIFVQVVTNIILFIGILVALGYLPAPPYQWAAGAGIMGFSAGMRSAYFCP